MSEPIQLLRALRRRDLVGILINAMIGAGILAAPAKVYSLAEGWSFWVLAASAIILVPLVLCFADLGSRFSNTGGPYLYAREALPGWMAFAVGWLNWLSQAVSVATLANLFVSYLAGFFPELESGLPRAAVIIGLGTVLTAIVLGGIRQSARAINLLAIVKISFIVGFAAAGLAFVQPVNLAIRSPAPGAATFAQAILIYLFAYSGFERASVVAGETRDPQRDNPIALVTSVAVVTLAYAGVLLVCIGVLGDPTATDRPLAEAGRLLFGGAGALAVSAGAMAVILGTILVITVAMPRMLLALAEHGQLPQALGAVHPKWRTPHRAILISSALAFGWALSSDLLGSLTFATAARLVSYILCCVALWRLARRPDAPAARFALPARSIVALLTAAIFTGVLLLGATKELPALAIALAIGLAILLFSARGSPAQAVEPPAP
jgi:amino acid transporter